MTREEVFNQWSKNQKVVSNYEKELYSFIPACGKRRSNKEVESFKTKIMLKLTNYRPIKEIKANQKLVSVINELLNTYACGMINILGWEAQIMQYLWFDTETFEDILEMSNKYYATSDEIFESVKEHNDKEMSKKFLEWFFKNYPDEADKQMYYLTSLI